MRFKIAMTMFAFVLVAGLVLSTGPVSAQGARSGFLHVTKNCSAFAGGPGSYCTITSSNLPLITHGSKVFYDYPNNLGTPTGLMDTNVVLYVGAGDWAVGRCTVDNTTNIGLCTFSDGAGPLTGFQARVNVSSADGINYTWVGTYSFNSAPGN